MCSDEERESAHLTKYEEATEELVGERERKDELGSNVEKKGGLTTILAVR